MKVKPSLTFAKPLEDVWAQVDICIVGFRDVMLKDLFIVVGVVVVFKTKGALFEGKAEVLREGVQALN